MCTAAVRKPANSPWLSSPGFSGPSVSWVLGKSKQLTKAKTWCTWHCVAPCCTHSWASCFVGGRTIFFIRICRVLGERLKPWPHQNRIRVRDCFCISQNRPQCSRLGVVTIIETTRCNNESRMRHQRDALMRRARCGQALRGTDLSTARRD